MKDTDKRLSNYPKNRVNITVIIGGLSAVWRHLYKIVRPDWWMIVPERVAEGLILFIL